MVRLVLFDIDGTLIHTGGAGVKAFGRVFATQFGLENATDGISFAGRTDSGIVREVFHRHGLESSRENLDRFFAAYVFLLDFYLGQLHGGPQPGVPEWLEELRGLSPRPVIGLLTGNIRLGAEIKLRHFGLWETFQTGGFADDHVDRNEIALAARRRGQAWFEDPLQPEEVLVVGDTPLDVACGRHIGARVLAVATGRHEVDELAACSPDWTVRDLREISVRQVCA